MIRGVCNRKPEAKIAADELALRIGRKGNRIDRAICGRFPRGPDRKSAKVQQLQPNTPTFSSLQVQTKTKKQKAIPASLAM